MSGAGGDPYFGPGTMAFLTQEFEQLPQPTITQGHELEDDKYIAAMMSVMTDLAAEGNVVIVGRGGSIILRDQPQSSARRRGRAVRGPRRQDRGA